MSFSNLETVLPDRREIVRTTCICTIVTRVEAITAQNEAAMRNTHEHDRG